MVMCRSNPALEPRDMAGAARKRRAAGGSCPRAGPRSSRRHRRSASGSGAHPAQARRRPPLPHRHGRTAALRMPEPRRPPSAAVSQHVTRVAKRQAEFGQRRRRLWLWGLASASRSRKPETRRTGLRECARKQRETGKKYHRGSHQQWIKVLPATRENKLVLKLQTKYFHVPSSVRIILKQVPQKTCLRYS